VKSLREVWAFPTVILLVSSIILIAPSIDILADSSDVSECSASFSGTVSEPFNAETMITINATKGNYDVEFDYAHAVGDEGTVSFVKSSALEPSSVIFVEGETISTILTSGETILDDGVITLYHKDLLDCEIIFDNSSIPETGRIVLPVTITELDSFRFLVNATIPDKESAIDFTKLVIAYVTNPEASVSYNIRNVSIVAADDGVGGECTVRDIAFRDMDTRINTANDIVRLDSVLGVYDIGLDYIGDFGTTAHFYADSDAVNPTGDVKFQEGEILSFNVRSTGGATDQIYPSVFLVNKELSDCDMLEIGAPESVAFTILDIQGVHPEYEITIQVPDSNDIEAKSFSKLVVLFAETPESTAYYVIPDNVTIVSQTLAIADATTQATGQSMFAGGRTFYGEQFSPDAAIINNEVDCATVELRRHDAPTGNAEIGFYDSNMNLVKQFGTIDVSTLTTGYKAYEFCLPQSDLGHQIQDNQILAVKYDGGDSINRIDVRRSNIGSGPDYDSLAAYHVNYDTIWHIYNTDGKSRDLLFKLANS
jgi:hypothetical protein